MLGVNRGYAVNEAVVCGILASFPGEVGRCVGNRKGGGRGSELKSGELLPPRTTLLLQQN